MSLEAKILFDADKIDLTGAIDCKNINVSGSFFRAHLYKTSGWNDFRWRKRYGAIFPSRI